MPLAGQFSSPRSNSYGSTRSLTIASCKLHDVDAEIYLVEIIHVLALLAARPLP